jgi:biopolymer transport protein ExbD
MGLFPPAILTRNDYRMRHILACILSLAVAVPVLAQKSAQKKIQFDTLELDETNAEKSDTALNKDLHHSIDLRKNSYRCTLAGKKYSFSSIEEVSNFAKTNKNSITSKRINIILDSLTFPARVVNILEVLNKLEIKDYKVEHADGKTVQSFPASISFADNFELSDPAALVISIYTKNLNFSFQNTVHLQISMDDLDRFLSIHKSDIDAGKVALTGDGRVSFARFNAVVALLKKHGYLKYKLELDSNP